MRRTYRLSRVNLDVEDLRVLWRRLRDLFETAPHERLDGSLHTTFEIKTKPVRGHAGETIVDSDIERVLESGAISDIVEEASLRFGGSFVSKTNESQRERRELELDFGGSLGTWVTTSGNQEWTERVRGFLEPFVAQRRRDVLARRVIMSFVLAMGPGLALFVRGYLSDSIIPVVAALAWIQAASLLSWIAAESVYPDDSIVINERGRRPPWYLDWAQKVLIGIVVGGLTTIVGAILWPS